jgi:hypothetical protein
MSEPHSDRSIIVTAQERAHPALRKLARACIALARQLRNSVETPAADLPPSATAEEGQRHD